MLLQGDSYLSDELVATVSTGKGCTGQYPGIYSRTSYFYDWIAETVCNISQDPPNWYKCQLRTPAPTTSQMPSMAPTLGRELEFVAWSPSQPLNECQGDCDTDQDCAGDFVCFPATGASQVPGCKGNPWSFPFSDFCVLPQKEQAEIITTQVPTTNATQVPDVNATLAPTSTNATLALTTDCATLAPSIGNATLAPTSTNATQAPTTDCATLALTTTNATLAPTTNATILDQLLEEESNLTALEAIQDLSTSAPTISNNLLLSFVSWDPTEPLGACQGDCDRDEDCLGDMVCLSRSSTPDRSIPGCQESTAYIPSIAHFCASSLNKMEEQQNPPTASPIADTLMTTAVPAAQFALPDVVLEFVTWDSTEPLDHCQGDCDNNADCAGELICWKNVNPPGCARSSGSYVPSIAHFCVYPV